MACKKNQAHDPKTTEKGRGMGKSLGFWLVPGVLILAGCAGVYDPSKLPMADAVHSAGVELCVRDAAAGRFKTAGESIECRLAVDAAFVKTVKLSQGF